MATLKFFNNWFKTREIVLGQYGKKGGGEGDVDIGMFSLDVWRNNTKTVYTGSFYWL